MNEPSNFHWSNRKHASKQKATKTGAYAQPSAPMPVRPWNDLEAARNNAETVANIRDYLLRQHHINLKTNAA